LNLLDLSPSQFESMTFDIVSALGLRNVVWRTPGSDGGRDIEGEYFISDLSGQYQCQKWYVECKRYKGSVNWPTIWEKISYAESNSADILLIATSSSLTPQAVDNVTKWNATGKKPLIRFWGEVDISSTLNLHPDIAAKYGLSSNDSGNLKKFNSITELLLKITHSISPDIGSVSNEKLSLVHAISELLICRIDDINKSGNYYFRAHHSEDKFDWFNYHGNETSNFDKHSLRAVLSYINFILKNDFNVANVKQCCIELNTNRELIESEKHHLQSISAMSNFLVRFETQKIHFEVTKEALNG